MQFDDLVGLFLNEVYVYLNLSHFPLFLSFCLNTFLLFFLCSHMRLMLMALEFNFQRLVGVFLVLSLMNIVRWHRLLLRLHFRRFPLLLQLLQFWARSHLFFFIFVDPISLSLGVWMNISTHKLLSPEALAVPGPQVSSISLSTCSACFSCQPISPSSSSLSTFALPRCYFPKILITDFIFLLALFLINN